MAASPLAAFEGKVVGIVDADTLDVLDEAKTVRRIRIHGVDAPERGQPFSDLARQALSNLVATRQVTVDPVDEDRYQRTVARVRVDGKDVGKTMIGDGWAWHYVKYDRSPDYAAAEKAARQAGNGLWRDTHAIPPWEWRKMPKADRDTARHGVPLEAK